MNFNLIGEVFCLALIYLFALYFTIKWVVGAVQLNKPKVIETNPLDILERAMVKIKKVEENNLNG